MKNRKIISTIVIFAAFIFTCIFIKYVNNRTEAKKEERENEYSEIKYTIPKYFEEEKDLYNKEYKYSENSVYCYIHVNANKKSMYNNPKEYLEKYITFSLTDEVSDLTEFNNDKAKGYQISVKSEDRISYYYSLESSNYLYTINYRIYDYKNGDREDAETNKCIKAREEFIKSIEIY